jgi:DNA-binding transcriptional ArsR family regulator
MHPATEDLSLPNILYALGDPLRLRMVEQLDSAQEGLCCQQICMGEGIAKSTQSHQFKVLREAGVIHMMPMGRRILVTLRRDDLELRFPGLLDTVLANHRRQNGMEQRAVNLEAATAVKSQG